MDIPYTTPTPYFALVLLIGLPILFAIIHINVAVYLYRYSKENQANNGVPLFFMHPIVLGLTGLVFGLLAAFLSSLILAIERRHQ